MLDDGPLPDTLLLLPGMRYAPVDTSPCPGAKQPEGWMLKEIMEVDG